MKVDRIVIQVLNQIADRSERAKDNDKMNPTEQIFYVALMSLMTNQNLTSNEAIETLLQAIDDKSAKSKKRTALKRIYEEQIKNKQL